MALTRSQLMRIKENRRYWRDREAKQREAYIRTDNEELTEINRVYDEMYRWAEREINAFYGKYATAEGIDITEAKRRVSQLDIAEYEKLAKEYVKDKDFSPQANAEMRLYNATMKINRLELLKAQIGLKLVDGINDIDKHWEKIATERATQEIIRQSGILGKTLTDTETARTAKQIVNADFYNATFSQRIWSHMDNLKSDLAIELQKGFIAGVSSREMARRLKEHAFDKSEKDAFRLARTELRRIQTDVAKDNYERNGIEQYEYMAVNPSACPICKELDGRIFDVAKMKAGLNAPPIHPNCHCTTAPHIDDNEYEQWLTWLEKGGTTEQWDEMSPAKRQNWYDSVVKSTPKNSDDITTRKDAENALRNMGFDRVEDSFSKLSDDMVIDQTKRLRTLEGKFGAVGKSVNAGICAVNSGRGTQAYVRHRVTQVNNQSLSLCPSYFTQSLKDIRANQKRNSESGWSMPCSDKHLGHYTVTHEYGHMLHNVLLTERADPFDKFKTRATTIEGRVKAYDKYTNKVLGGWNKEIIEIAKEKNPDFSLKDNLSRYGHTNNAEFFAEVFANSQCGSPNELGGAMNTWLERNVK